jgi:TRAP-type mannitol/chloroaromatic compound transport system permease small subunit
MDLPQTRLSRVIDPLLSRIGQWTSWMWFALMGIIVGNVVLRYAFGEGHIEIEEIQWHIYSFGFLLGLGYAYQADSHIRVDVLHERWSQRTQAWVELYGILLFLLPFIAVILIFSFPFVATSFELGEVSQSPGGLPYRWFVKAALPTGFVLLLLAVLSRLSRVCSVLFVDLGETHGGE